jgi:hypothetical protein
VKTLDGRLVILGGASRSGKTAYAFKEAGRAPRAFAWDIEDQWSTLPGWRRLTTARELLAAAATPGPGRYAYVAGGDLQKHFDFWAKTVFTAADVHGPLVAIAEELADVSSPGKAPAGWGVLLRRGLKRGATIYAISQRWAEADKTALGNASEFIIFRQSSADDVKYLARKTRVPVAEIDGLRPLEFVRYDAHAQAHTRGKLRF